MWVLSKITDIFRDILWYKEWKNMSGFTHFNQEGDAHMVDVHAKEDTVRKAVASGKITMNQEVFEAVKAGSMQKGDVLSVARIAGIMGAKKTSDLIPLCHNIGMTNCEIRFEMNEEEHSILAICETGCVGKTGVEMEALTGVNIALLTVYDMCKAMDRAMEISEIHLLKKDGGKSGHYER